MLVPRPDSEWLVSEAEVLLKNLDRADSPRRRHRLRLSGGGPRRRVKSARVTAVDVSREAVAVATRNALSTRPPSASSRATCSPRSPARRSTSSSATRPTSRRADLAGLQPEVRDHEPRLALDGGPDGLDVVRRLLSEGPAALKPGGALLIEIGHDQADEARRLFVEAGWRSTAR